MATPSERHLLQRVRSGDQQAWQELIDRYEGRLTAYVNSRLHNRSAGEDIVQETLMGFLLSLPNYDETTPLESWLFSIAAHKLTDHLRRSGRRPTVPLAGSASGPGEANVRGPARAASSLLRSHERKDAEEEVIAGTLAELIQQWKQKGEWERLQCIELLFALGWRNQMAAERLGISEQAVANHKQFVMAKLKDAVTRARLPGFRLADFSLDS